MDSKQSLLESKTLTISRLLEISAENTPDPTPHLYDDTFYVAAGFLGVAAVSNMMLRPPDIDKLLEEEERKRKK